MKTPLPESLFNFIKKETLGQVFSCEFSEISKNTSSYRIPLVAAFTMNTEIYNMFLSILDKKSLNNTGNAFGVLNNF